MRIIPRAVAVAITTVALSLAAGCGGSPVRYAGESVKDADTFLSGVERTWQSDIAADRVTKHQDARCYFSTPAEAETKTIEQVVYCGPVRHYTEKSAAQAADDAEDVREDEDYEGPEPGDAGPGSWDTYVFQAVNSEPDGTGDYELVSPRAQLWGTEITSGMKLFRPDGKQPPSDGDRLAAPPPPPVDSGFVTVTDHVDVKGAKQPKDARIVTPRKIVTVTQLGTADQLETGEGKRGPGKGEKFLVAKLSLADGPFEDAYDDTWSDDEFVNADVTYAIQIGDERKQLKDVASLHSGGDPESTSIVVSAPVGSDPQLLVSAAGKDQTISLTTGKRTSKVAEAFYAGKYDVGVSRQYAAQTFKKGDFELSLSLLFSNARLVPFDPERGWAPEGKNWLVLNTEQVEADWNGYPYSLFYDRQKTIAVKDGNGRTYKDLVKSETWESGPRNVTPVFEVAGDATTFTVSYKPAFTFSSSESAAFYQPTTGAGTLTPLTFDVSFEK